MSERIGLSLLSREGSVGIKSARVLLNTAIAVAAILLSNEMLGTDGSMECFFAAYAIGYLLYQFADVK